MTREEFDDLTDRTVTRQWQSTGGATIRIGTAGEWWFAWHSRRGKAWVFQFERSMADLVDQWLARGTWNEILDACESPREMSPRG